MTIKELRKALSDKAWDKQEMLAAEITPCDNVLLYRVEGVHLCALGLYLKLGEYTPPDTEEFGE